MNPALKLEETLEMRVAELLDRWPDAARVFIQFRMACVGCEFSRFDTLSDALRAHGLAAQPFLERLRTAIPNQGEGRLRSLEAEDPR